MRALSRFFGALLDGGTELRRRLTEAGDSEPTSVRRAARQAFETLWRRVTAPPGSVRTAADQADERRAAGVFWGLMEQFLEERGTAGRRRRRPPVPGSGSIIPITGATDGRSDGRWRSAALPVPGVCWSVWSVSLSAVSLSLSSSVPLSSPLFRSCPSVLSTFASR